MDIILVDTSGLTAATEGDIDPDLLSGIGAAIAASVANVQKELEAEGLLPPAQADAGQQDLSGAESSQVGEPDDAQPISEGVDAPVPADTTADAAADEADASGTDETAATAEEPAPDLDLNDPVLAGIAASVASSVASLGFDVEESPNQATAEEGDDAPPLYSPPGKEKLYRQLDWLLHHGQQFRIIGCLPEVAPGKRDWFSELLYDLRVRYEVETLMVIQARHASSSTFWRLFDLGFRTFIIYDDGTLDEWDIQERTLGTLDFIRELHTDEEGGRRHVKQSEFVCWGLWVEANAQHDNYRRLRLWQDCGIPWQEIVGAQFSIGSPPPAVDTEALRGNDYLPSALTCRLYNNSVTIDTNGSVLFCPRYCNSELTPVANIFAHSPEETFVLKGSRSLEVGCIDRCANCNYGGRHFWPHDVVDVVREFVALGKTEQGAAAFMPPVSPVGTGTSFDLSEADPETQERELAAFEESLSQWTSNMEQWQEDEGNKA